MQVVKLNHYKPLLTMSEDISKTGYNYGEFD